MNSRELNNQSPLLFQLPKSVLSFSDMSGNSFLMPVAVENVAETESYGQDASSTPVTEAAPVCQLQQPLHMYRGSPGPKMAVPYSESGAQTSNVEAVQDVQLHNPSVPPPSSDLGTSNHFGEIPNQPAYSMEGPATQSFTVFSGFQNEPPTIQPESISDFINVTSSADYSSQSPVITPTTVPTFHSTTGREASFNSSTQNFIPQNPYDRSLPEFYSRIYEPVKPYWLFLDIVETKEIWYGFSEVDSNNLEMAFQKDSQAVVPVDGGRYDAILSERIKKPVYFEAKNLQISRGTWFYRRNSSQRFLPFPEIASDLLEQHYANCVETGQWQKRVDIHGIGSVIIESPQVLLYYRNEVEIWPTLPDPKAYPQPVKRGLPENFEIMENEINHVDHLVFIVQGIGSFCDLRFRTVSECVDGFRDIANKLLAVHFNHEHQTGQVGRVEFLPLAWHAKLHTCDKGFVRSMRNITLPSIPKLRHFTNDTLLDILLYSSPTYCQSIIDTVASELNVLYETFLKRNPDFSGKVFVAGHSLGSLILFDILANQKLFDESRDQSNELDYKLSSNEQESNSVLETDDNKSPSKNNITEIFDSLESMLQACHLEEYIELFEKEKIDLSSVSLLSNDDLKDLGIPTGPRKKLLNSIHSNNQKSSEELNVSTLPSTTAFNSINTTSQNQTYEEEMQEMSDGSDCLKFPMKTSPCMSSIKYPKLHFEPACFFALGSPISMFLTVRGYAYISEDFRFPTCPGFFHIFHPYDPVAFRIEHLIDPTFSAKPVLIPHHKGRKRMHLEIRENLSKVGSEIKQKVLETLRYTWDSLSGFARAHSLSNAVEAEVDRLMKQQIADSEYETHAPSETSGEDIQIGSLNGGRRIDYVLQEKPIEALNDYIFALTSHATYWDSEDTVLMILREIYATQGISLTSQPVESKYYSANSFQNSASYARLNSMMSDPALYQSSHSNTKEFVPVLNVRTQQRAGFVDPYHEAVPMSQPYVPPPVTSTQLFTPTPTAYPQSVELPPTSNVQSFIPSAPVSQPVGTSPAPVSQPLGPPPALSQPLGPPPAHVSQPLGFPPASVSQPLGPPPASVSQPVGPPPLTGFVRKSPFIR